MFSLSLVTGHLFDRGYYRWLLGGGTTLFLLGIMMLSLAKEYYSIFLCQGVCLGLGVGCMFAPALSVPTHHFLKRRALAIGLVSTGSSCGGVVFRQSAL
jgi:MFS family permease